MTKLFGILSLDEESDMCQPLLVFPGTVVECLDDSNSPVLKKGSHYDVVATSCQGYLLHLNFVYYTYVATSDRFKVVSHPAEEAWD